MRDQWQQDSFNFSGSLRQAETTIQGNLLFSLNHQILCGVTLPSSCSCWLFKCLWGFFCVLLAGSGVYHVIMSIWIITSLEPDDTPKGCTVVVQQVAYVNDAAMMQQWCSVTVLFFCSEGLYCSVLEYILSKENLALNSLEAEASAWSPTIFQIATVFVLQGLTNGPVVLQQSPAAPLCFPYILFGSTGLCRCWRQRCGLTTQRHLSVWLFCFRTETKSWALAVSWKPLNLVPNAAKDVRSNEDKQDSTCFSILLNSFTPINACVWDGKQRSARYGSEQLQRGWESQGQLFYSPDLYQCSICPMTSPTSGLPPALCGVWVLEREAVFSTPVPPAFRTSTPLTGE